VQFGRFSDRTERVPDFPDDDELPPEILHVVEAMARTQARLDYAARISPKAPDYESPSLRYRKYLAKNSTKTTK
jgi:hypothetical protein